MNVNTNIREVKEGESPKDGSSNDGIKCESIVSQPQASVPSYKHHVNSDVQGGVSIA